MACVRETEQELDEMQEEWEREERSVRNRKLGRPKPGEKVGRGRRREELGILWN